MTSAFHPVSEGGHASGMRPDGEGADALSPEGHVYLELPAPPSANHAWINRARGGRARSAAYVDWEYQAGWKLRAQRPARVAGPVVVLIGVERHSLSADIDNRIKLSLDLLVRHQVIVDDKHVIGLAAAWNPPGCQLVRLAIAPARNAMTVTFHLADDKGAYGGWFLSAPSTPGDA
jgi:Holliday junction resolvase RusA-like endonuclease